MYLKNDVAIYFCVNSYCFSDVKVEQSIGIDAKMHLVFLMQWNSSHASVTVDSFVWLSS